MLKEMHEQPRAITDTFRGRIAPETGNVVLPDVSLAPDTVRAIERVVLVACGTAFHAAMLGRTMMERLAGIPAEVDLGSEFRYRDALWVPRLWWSPSPSPARPPTRSARSRRPGQGLPDPRHHQRRRLGAGARGDGCALHARRPRDRRGVDQGVLDDDRGDLPPRPLARPSAGRHHGRGREEADPRPGRDPAPRREDARARWPDRGDRPRPGRRARLPLSRTRAAVSDRARRARSS